MTKTQIRALRLMARKGGACPGSDAATQALSMRMADKLVGLGLAELRYWRGQISYHLTAKGAGALSKKG